MEVDEIAKRGSEYFERHGIDQNRDITVTLNVRECSVIAAYIALAQGLGHNAAAAQSVHLKITLATTESLAERFPDDDPEAVAIADQLRAISETVRARLAMLEKEDG